MMRRSRNHLNCDQKFIISNHWK